MSDSINEQIHIWVTRIKNESLAFINSLAVWIESVQRAIDFFEIDFDIDKFNRLLLGRDENDHECVKWFITAGYQAWEQFEDTMDRAVAESAFGMIANGHNIFSKLVSDSKYVWQKALDMQQTCQLPDMKLNIPQSWKGLRGSSLIDDSTFFKNSTLF